MKTTSAITQGERAGWLALLVASAAAMTSYLGDSNGPSISGQACFGLFVAAWATVAYAWFQNRCYLPQWLQSGPRVLMLVVVEIVAVSLVRSSFFACPSPPPSMAVYEYVDLTRAIRANDLNAVKRLLASGASAEYVPAEDDICRVMAESHDPCEAGERPFDRAFLEGNVAIAAALLDHGASLDLSAPFNNSSALNVAVERGDIPMMQMLIQHGTPVHGPDKDDEPLWKAIEAKQVGSVAFLLAHGANPNMHDPVPDGRDSALQFARRQNPAIVKLLKHAGAKE